MILGVTGSRDGLTSDQYLAAIRLFEAWHPEITGFHNGGCIGADYKLFVLATTYLECPLDIWPANLSDDLKFTYPDWDFVTVHDPMPPLKRNLEIIKASTEIWAFPNTDTDPGRGGTWHTIRHANRCLIVTPDGETRAVGF